MQLLFIFKNKLNFIWNSGKFVLSLVKLKKIKIMVYKIDHPTKIDDILFENKAYPVFIDFTDYVGEGTIVLKDGELFADVNFENDVQYVHKNNLLLGGVIVDNKVSIKVLSF